MRRNSSLNLVGLAIVVASSLTMAASDTNADGNKSLFVAHLESRQEVPAVIADGSGIAVFKLVPGEKILYRLFLRHTEGDVLFAHIHIAQKGVNGGVATWLCSSTGAGPAGTPACPDPKGFVDGEITADRVSGIPDQGIGDGELGELMNAIRRGVAYVNVHTAAFGPGELRGQIRRLHR